MVVRGSEIAFGSVMMFRQNMIKINLEKLDLKFSFFHP